MTTERMQVERTIEADPTTIFRVLCDPQGHVAIDSSGMLLDATGDPVTAVGDTFVVHMDREALNDFPMGRYDVTVGITVFEQDRELAWALVAEDGPGWGHYYGYRLEPVEGGTLVTSYYDWSAVDAAWKEAGVFPVLSEGALRATLGILARTVARRAERAVVALGGAEAVRAEPRQYLNRLSDLLFVLARVLNRANLDGRGGDDVYWKSEKLARDGG